jgi:two-component system sensor histidine kinase HydH
MTTEHIFDELKRYVAFDAQAEAALRGLAQAVQPDLAQVIDTFYERIEQHPGAMAALHDDAQIERLKGTLRVWITELFQGPWDQAYYERRLRIGRRHVEVRLPQRYMFTAMGVIRGELNRMISARKVGGDQLARELHALNALLDLELAVMLHSYQEDWTRQLQRQERLATFGQLTSTIGHELRNPLGVVESSAYLLRQRLHEDPASVRHLDRIQGQVSRANRIITTLLDIVRDRAPTLVPALPADLIERAVRLVQQDRRLDVQVAPASDAPQLRVDPDLIVQILLNLLQNAADAVGESGQVRITTERNGATLRIVVNDDGPGIDPEVRHRLFEPLVTTKSGGVGLGLALCQKLAGVHGGQMELTRGALPGAAFALALPIPPG